LAREVRAVLDPKCQSDIETTRFSLLVLANLSSQSDNHSVLCARCLGKIYAVPSLCVGPGGLLPPQAVFLTGILTSRLFALNSFFRRHYRLQQMWRSQMQILRNIGPRQL